MNLPQFFCGNGNAGNLCRCGMLLSVEGLAVIIICYNYTLENVSLTISSKERMVMSCLKTSMSH